MSTDTLKLAGIDFITSVLRVLLNKVAGNNSPREYFCRLAAETVLTLSAVMVTFKDQVNATTLNIILNHVCKWIAEEQSARVRTTLYAAILHVVRLFKSVNDTGSATVTSFSLILENLCKDCYQSKEIGKMQAMYMMGEIIRLTANKGLIGTNGVNVIQTNRTPLNDSDNSGYRNKTRAQDKSGDVSEFSTFNTSLSPINPVGGHVSFLNSTITSKKQNVSLGTTNTAAISSVMSYMFAKGFLGNLVEAILTVDDGDLVKLFSNQPLHIHLKSLYVFEAKVSLLCRFASTGRRAILFLMDINVVHKFADMRVLQIQYFQEDSSGARPAELSHNNTTKNNFSDLSSQTPTRKGVMDLLFGSILKLLHSMVDAAPKNVLLVEQVGLFINNIIFNY